MSEQRALGPGEDGTGLHAEFYFQAMPDAEASAREGRAVYRDVPFVRITCPGDKLNIVERAVREEVDSKRWPELYQQFKRGRPQVAGTPLRDWPTDPPLRPARIKELEACKVLSVEHLAAVPDANLNAMPPGTLELRKQARTWLEARTASAPMNDLRGQVAALQAEIEALRAKKGK